MALVCEYLSGADQSDLGIGIAGARILTDAKKPIVNPATEEIIGFVGQALSADVDVALERAAEAFGPWRATPVQMRSDILRKAAALLRERSQSIATAMTLEQGKPRAQSITEVHMSAEAFDWYAAEVLRSYGRVIPARTAGGRQMVFPEAIGPVAAFTAWNFPALLAARKIAPALAAGCSCILKPAEETPASALALGRALHDAGLPAGVLSILFGDPVALSRQIIRSKHIRKITFTGSVTVGKLLASLAAEGVKPCTLELGGHAPVLVLDDADIDAAASMSAIGKTRNAGQVCTSPTRFFVQSSKYDEFVEKFARGLDAVVIDNGLESSAQMGPLANGRRLEAIERTVEDAVTRGGTVVTGGTRIGNRGYFYKPTLLIDVPADAVVNSEEPFGPVAVVSRFADLESVFELANHETLGLAGYAFTSSHPAAVKIAEKLEVGAIGINSFAVSQIEGPFGGVKESGFGYEGGPEGIQAFLHQKYVNHA